MNELIELLSDLKALEMQVQKVYYELSCFKCGGEWSENLNGMINDQEEHERVIDEMIELIRKETSPPSIVEEED